MLPPLSSPCPTCPENPGWVIDPSPPPGTVRYARCPTCGGFGKLASPDGQAVLDLIDTFRPRPRPGA